MGERAYTADDLAPDLADRMRKALRLSGLGVQEMADYLDVARNTVSTWINGRIVPSTQTVRLWALRTGVPYLWLRDGTLTDAAPHAVYAPRDSNPEPSDSDSGGAVLPFPAQVVDLAERAA